MKKILLALTAVALGSTGALATFACGPNKIEVKVEKTYRWTENDATKVKFDQRRLIPQINYENKTAFIEEYEIWDSWALLNNAGEVVRINDYYFWFALSKPTDGSGSTKIMFFYSKDGANWISGGFALATNLEPNTEEWSGSAMYDAQTKTINLFYTVSKYVLKESGKNWNQRLALAKMKVAIKQNKPFFEKPYMHKILATADGDFYQTHHDAEAANYSKQKWAFRDPFYFQDPKTKKEYLLFEGNTGKLSGKENERLPKYTGGLKNYPEGYDFKRSNHANSAIGIAELNLNKGEVKLLAPLWASNLVSDETERPALIYNDQFKRYYLFTTTHGYYNMNLAPGLNENDSLHGFTAKDSLFAPMKPINNDGLILYSKPEKDKSDKDNIDYSYAWGVLKDNKESNTLLTLAFSNFSSQGKNSKMQKVRGAAPTLVLKISDDEISIDSAIRPAQIVR